MPGELPPIPKYGEDASLPEVLPGATFPLDPRPAPTFDAEGIDRTNDPLQGPWSPVIPWPNLKPGEGEMTRAAPEPSRTTYAPEDTNQDGIVSEIERWMFHQQSSPAERMQDWVEQNVWAKGYTVDMGTGEIVDPQRGIAIGRLPDFG